MSVESALESSDVEKGHASLGGRKITVNAGWLAFEKLYAMALGVTVSVSVANYLGASLFGVLGYALSISAMVRCVATLGLDEIVVRELARNPKSANSFLGTSFVIRFVGGSLAVLCALGISAVARPNDWVALQLVLVVSLMHILDCGLVANNYFTATVQNRWTAIAGVSALTITSCAKLLVVYTGGTLQVLAATHLLMSIVNAVLLAGFYYRVEKQWPTSWAFDSKVAFAYARDAWPRLPANIVVTLRDNFGLLAIASILPDSVLGEYSLALRFYVLLCVLPSVVGQSFAGSLVSAHRVGRECFLAAITRAYTVVLCCVVMASMLLVFIACVFIPVFYGENFPGAGRYLLLFLLPLFLSSLGQIRLWFIVCEKLNIFSLVGSIVMFVVTVVSNYVLVPRFGVSGAVTAIALAYLSVYFFDLFFASMRHNWRCAVQGVHPVLLFRQVCKVFPK